MSEKKKEVPVVKLSIEEILESFGVTRLDTAKDEGMLSFKNIKEKLITLVKYNIEQYRNDTWSTKNILAKLLVDKKKNNKRITSILTLRIGGKKIYRCTCETPDNESKIQFLSAIQGLLENGNLDDEITNFCEKEVLASKERKKAARDRRRKRKAEEKALIEKGKMAEQIIAEAKKKATEQVQSTKEPETVA